MSISTPEAFFEVLEKSELVTADQLENARREAGDETDPKAVARKLIRDGLLSKWQAQVLLTGRHTLRLGKYKLVERLSSGDAGDVYLASHDQMGRQVALKTLSRQYTKDSSRIAHFLDDAREISKLDHRNLIHVFDIDQQGDRFFLVMEHVAGQDLQTHVEQNGPLPSDKVAEVVRQAAEGLAHAHDHSILHRGIKPSNLLADEQGTVKVLNFGISQLAGGENENGAAVADGFDAPEQKDGGEVDQRADIYALGCTGIYLLTGKVPNGSTQPKSKLEKILRKMMAVDPGQRFQTAGDAATMLKKWQSHNQPKESAAAAATSAPEGVKPAPPKKKRLKQAVPLPEEPIVTVAEPSESAAADNIFAIDTESKGKRKKSKQPAAPAPTAPVDSNQPIPKQQKTDPIQQAIPQTEPKPKVSPAGRKKLSRGALIGIAGGGVALIAGIVVAVILISSGNDDEPLAGNEDKPLAEQTDTPADPDPEAEWDPESGQPRPTADGSSSVPEDDPPADASPTVDPPDVPPDPKPEPTDDSNKTDPVDPGPKHGSDPKSPDGTKPDEPKPVDPPKTDPKPEPKDPPPKPEPPPKPKVKPFAKLAKAVTLPALGTPTTPLADATKPVALGDIELADLDIFTAELAGGDQAYNAKQTFTMRNADRGLAERAFEIFLKQTNGEELPIAKWWVEKNKLWFQWTDKAQQEVASNYARNCLLTLATGTETHQVALRTPASVDPLAVDLDKGATAKVSARLDFLPQQDFVTVELSVPKNFPPHAFDANKKSIEVTKDFAKILIGQPGQQALFFHVVSAMKGKNTIEVSASPKLGPQQRRPAAFRKKDFEAKLQQAKQALQVRTQQIFALEKQAKNNQQKQFIAQEKAKLTQAQADIANGDKLANFLKTLAGAAVNVRIFYRAGDYQVDLAKTQ